MKNNKLLQFKKCACIVSAVVMFTAALPLSMLTTPEKVYASSVYLDEVYAEETDTEYAYTEETEINNTDSIYNVVVHDDTVKEAASDYEAEPATVGTIYGYEELPEYESIHDKYGGYATDWEQITIDGVLFNYAVTEKGAAEVVLLDTEAEEVVFPQTIDGHKVVKVDAYGRTDWFYRNLKKITVPDGVESVGGFGGCINLETVILPDTVTEIRKFAFYNTYSLKNINWPKNLKVIAHCAFEASGLESAVLPEGLLLIQSEAFKAGNDAYSNPEMIPDNYAYLKELVIPSTVKIIDESAFSGQGRLTSEIKLPSCLETLGASAFYGTKVTGDIVFPDGFTRVSGGVFAMSNIRSVVIPNGVTYIGSNAFYFCSELTSVSLPDNYIFFDTNAGGDLETFALCEKLSITIPAGVEFSKYDNPRTIFWGVKSVTFADGHPLYTSDDCYIYNKDRTVIQGAYDWKRTEYKISDEVKTIGEYTFKNTKYLKKMTIPDTVTEIGEGAFWESTIEELVISDSVTSIGTYLCFNCDNLKKVTLSKNISVISQAAFSITPIEEITIPDSVTEIGESAFSSTLLKQIKIPDSVKSVGNAAFAGCFELESIVLSKNIETISRGVFSGCESLKNINLPDNLETIGEYSFDGCKNLENINLPVKVKTIGDYAFRDCGFKVIEIPESVESLGKDAFKYRLSEYDYGNLPSTVLNEGIKEIDSFYPLSGDKIIIPTSVEKIKLNDNAKASQLILPGNINKASLAESAFSSLHGDVKDIWIENTETELHYSYLNKGQKFNIYGYAGSAAQQMAQSYGHTFYEVSKKDCGNGTYVTYAVAEFTESISPKIESVSSQSAEYSKLAAMTGTDFAAYKVSFNGQSGELTPNAMVKVTVPLPDGYDISKCYAYVVNADGELEMVQMDKTDGVFSFWANYGGTFVITQSRVKSMEYNVYYHITFRDYYYDDNGENSTAIEEVLVKEGEAAQAPDWKRQCLALSWSADFSCVKESTLIDAIWTEAHEWDTEYTIDREATSDMSGQKSIHCSVHKDVIKPDSIVYIPVKFKGVGIGEDGNVYYYNNGVIDYSYTGFAEDSSGKKYWFDGGIAAKDKQVYDPATDNWYWFDADGTMAVSKDVYVPESNENRENGKWVRYDWQGHMVKGEDLAFVNNSWCWYRFDDITGEMTKGWYTAADGKMYYYDTITGGRIEKGLVYIDGTEYAFTNGSLLDCGWYYDNNTGNEYWYEKGIRQGLEGRGKEIYDPATDAWYWLDSIDSGKKAVSKDVYQESSGGKWVRYDSNGHMIKGWQYENGNAWYFDVITGSMLKGWNCINEEWYYFDEVTGTLV